MGNAVRNIQLSSEERAKEFLIANQNRRWVRPLLLLYYYESHHHRRTEAVNMLNITQMMRGHAETAK